MAGKEVRWLLIKAGITVLAVIVLAGGVFCFHRMEGYGMYPEIRDGDLVITLRHGTVGSNDCVVYRDQDGKRRVGRIAGLPGQVITIENGLIRVDGSAMSYEGFYVTGAAEGGVSCPYQISEDAYFIVNDYRADTNDSRLSGEVRKEDLCGRVIFLFRRRGF